MHPKSLFLILGSRLSLLPWRRPLSVNVRDHGCGCGNESGYDSRSDLDYDYANVNENVRLRGGDDRAHSQYVRQVRMIHAPHSQQSGSSSR